MQPTQQYFSQLTRGPLFRQWTACWSPMLSLRVSFGGTPGLGREIPAQGQKIPPAGNNQVDKTHLTMMLTEHFLVVPGLDCCLCSYPAPKLHTALSYLYYNQSTKQKECTWMKATTQLPYPLTLVFLMHPIASLKIPKHPLLVKQKFWVSEVYHLTFWQKNILFSSPCPLWRTHRDWGWQDGPSVIAPLPNCLPCKC